MKQRTVLWLYKQDYLYLASIASNDNDTKNRSMRILLKWLQSHGVTSFRHIDAKLVPREPLPSTVATIEKRTRPIKEVA